MKTKESVFSFNYLWQLMIGAICAVLAIVVQLAFVAFAIFLFGACLVLPSMFFRWVVSLFGG